MKKVFLASAGLAATLLGAASTAEAASGFVGASYTRGNIDVSGTDVDVDGYGVHGSTVLGTGSGFDLQLDGSFSDSEDGEGVLAGALHVFSRDDARAFGAVVGAANADDTTLWNVGAEFNGYMNNTTFASAVAYNDLGDADGNAITVGGEFRFFVNDNFRVDAGLGWLNANFDSGADTDGYTWGLGGEALFGPVSVFGGVTQLHTNDVSATVTGSTIGVRYNFGAGSLKERDRSGPGMGLSTGGSLTNVF